MERVKTSKWAKTTPLAATNSHPLLFVVMTCDENNSPESRNLAMTATRTQHIYNYLVDGIVNQTIQYFHGFGSRSVEHQLDAFEKDWNSSMPRKEMNRYLRGCFLDTMVAGKEYIPPEQRAAL